jgi:asparagine synthase (glutamine-hydrolysing)
MCGIAGKLCFDFQAKVPPDLIREMTREIHYRGPDDEGIWVKGNVGLGHRRLSIIDLSSAGHQPMSNEDGSIWITYNGEIYNFLELREEMLKKGHKFTSHTDTEVILHLYEEYGPDCLTHLRGMFAFGLWDERQKCLFLARDRIGQKPLKYYLDDNCLIFASELKSILKDPQVKREVDIEAIDAYLTYQYVPHPMTGFKGIKKLPHAHYLLWQEGKLAIKRYWSLSFAPKLDRPQREITEGIIGQLQEAVNLRLISDVPLGSCLSGGIDSSAVVATMSQLIKQPVKTFSVGFKEASFNELPYARMISRKFHTQHYEVTVKPSAIDILPKLVWHYEEPFADSSALPTYYLFRMIKPHLKVVLSGDAGDENFAGYNRYVRIKQFAQYKNIPVFMRRYFIENILGLFLRVTKHNFFHTALCYAKAAGNDDLIEKYISIVGFFKQSEKKEIYSPAFYSWVSGCNPPFFLRKFFQDSDAEDKLEGFLFTDFNSYLPDDLMVKVDIASMMHSIECRVPMLDHKFLEFVARIPFEYKLRRLKKKYIFKKSLQGILPAKILNRRKKGFGVPIGKWLRDELKDFTYEYLLSSKSLSRGYFNKEAVRKFLDEHTQTGIDHSNKIWALLWLELWHRRFIDV